MKKNLYSVFKGIFIIALLCVSTSAFSQEIRYETTAFIDKDGVRREVNDEAIKITYYDYGRVLTCVSLGGGDPKYTTFKFKYHHSENGNNVYYLIGKDIITGREIPSPNSVIVVSADKSLVNKIFYLRGIRQYTYVYERKDESHGTMMR